MFEKYMGEMETCLYCPNLCLHSCPVSNAERKTTVSPWNKMSAAYRVAVGAEDCDEDTARLFYKCTGCLACQDACVHGVDVPRALMAGRAFAVRSGIDLFSPALFDRDTDRIGEAIACLDLPPMSRSEAVYVPGCEHLLQRPDDVLRTVRVLDALGCGPVSVGPSVCCGYPLLAGGHREDFRHQSTEHALELRGALRVIVGSGTCHHAMAEGVGATPHSIDSLIQVLAVRMDAPGYQLEKTPGITAYHGGCHQERREGQRDGAMRILQRVCEGPVRLLRWNGISSHCCGAAGCYKDTSPADALEAARLIRRMAVDVGAERLVSFDPDCVAHLEAAAGEDELEVVSAVQLLAWGLGVEERPPKPPARGRKLKR